jgi:Flp pilus assembly protein TadD
VTGCGADIAKGEECLRIGDYRNAIMFFERAVERNPGSARARAGLAKAWVQRCGAPGAAEAGLEQWQRAVDLLSYAAALDQESAPTALRALAQYQLAKAHIAREDSASARTAANQATRLAPAESRYLNFAAILNFRAGQTDQARDQLIQASVVDTADVTSFFNLGMLAWRDGKPLEAHRWWTAALKRAPRDPNVQYWFAQAEVALSGTGQGGAE